MTKQVKKIKLVPVTDDRNLITVDGNCIIVEVNKFQVYAPSGIIVTVYVPTK